MKRCPNCGSNEEDSAKVCHICGSRIDDAPVEPEFEYDFGGADNSVNQTAPQQPEQSCAQPFVAITIDHYKANKYKKQVVSWSFFILIASALGLIMNLIDIEDILELQSYLPIILDEYYGVVSTSINVYYAGVVLLVLMIVAAIVFLVFATKLKKFDFPVPNDDVFGVAKQAFYASIAVTVVETVLFIVELISFLNLIEMLRLLDEVDFSIGMDVFYLIKDLVVLCGTAVAMVYSLKLSKCKQK